MQIGLVESEAQNDIFSFADEVRNELHFEEIVGRSTALQRALREVEVVPPTDSGVLIL